MAKIIRCDKTTENIDNLDLETLQIIVEGYIEELIVPNEKGTVMIVNEDGIMLNLPLNTVATAIMGQPIVGNVILCSRKELH
ncbi:MAG: DUF3846 domain-containing protein [Methanogenium sp.]|jgi:hypothetical protein